MPRPSEYQTRSVALETPPASANADDHADWLELNALVSGRRGASLEDLVSALRTTGSTEALGDEAPVDRGSERAQAIAESAMSIIEQRSKSCARQESYPFTVTAGRLVPTGSARRSTYAYLLLLTATGINVNPPGEVGAGLFEDVSAVAARSYFGGDATGAQTYAFGFPRRVKPASFMRAVDDLCRQMGEGGGAKVRPTNRSQKDAKLDLVVWIPMPDGRAGKVLAFGQCATGNNWQTKLSELQSEAWCRKWFIDQPPVTPLRLFFLPHSVPLASWDCHAQDAGIIFDRCRIASHASRLRPDLRRRVVAWSTHALAERFAA